MFGLKFKCINKRSQGRAQANFYIPKFTHVTTPNQFTMEGVGFLKILPRSVHPI